MADQPTKTDLLERARELDISGRSSMDAEELQAAIAVAESSTSSDAAASGGEPSTPDEQGRPPLVEVAQERAANRKPRIVIGSDPTTQEDN